jgi:hypothetical protein
MWQLWNITHHQTEVFMSASIAIKKDKEPPKKGSSKKSSEVSLAITVCPRCGHPVPINFLPVKGTRVKRCIKGHIMALSEEVCRYGHPEAPTSPQLAGK